MPKKTYVEPKYPRVQVTGKLHVKLQKAADRAGVTMTELADGIITAALEK